MQLFRYYMVRLLKIAAANNVRVKMIGDRRRFAQDIIDGINRLEEENKKQYRTYLCDRSKLWGKR